MSSIFADEVYENMDWLTRAVEPFEFGLLKLIEEAGPTIVVNTLGQRAAKLFSKEETSTRTHVWMSSDFVLEGHPIMVAYPHINAVDTFLFAEKDIVVTTESSWPETDEIVIHTPDVANMQPSEVVELAYAAFAEMDEPPMDRANQPQTMRYYQILELLTDDGKAQYQSIYKLDLIEKLNLKNLDLLGELYEWIREYVRTGCKSSLHNIAKLVYMSSLGKPIYSIQTI